MNHGLSITLRRPSPHRVLIIVKGLVDEASAPDLKRALVESIRTPDEETIVDIARVDRLGSLGLGVLLYAAKRTVGGPLVVVCGCEAMRVLRLLGIDRVISLHLSRTVARAA